ncbi:ubiquitin carboxyl-terminal hydrolase [Zychaea mexicana]|uniref:ubiquitin carboxyl-terminal hydrolase n=1 Tax=Zychaea mexicana TaxID=64656 RepID=UPI0022FE7911|nr:ubiquitin carboxyl-terminal hydrolase [Zychaea mexicana]KAI9492079.1 ubiquitin carboxyl-terminal hydrolase [Zychaea mexicana]
MTVDSPTAARKRQAAIEEEQPWCLIESEPDIFTELCSTYGAKDVAVQQVFTLDMIPKKAYGLIFASRYDDSTPIPDSWIEKDDDRDKVFFCCQVITNICATLAVLAVLFNADHLTDIGDHLRELKSMLLHVDPVTRGMAIGNDTLLRKAHNSFAGAQAKAAISPKRRKASPPKKKGRKPKAPVVEEEVIYHYISYVHAGGFLWELDGMNRMPIKHTPCTQDNWLEAVEPVLQRKIQEGGEDICMLAVVPGAWTEQGREDIAEIRDVEKCLDAKLDELEPSWRNMDDFTVPTITCVGNPTTIVEDYARRSTVSALIQAKNHLADQIQSRPFDSTFALKERDMSQLENTRRKHDFTGFIKKFISHIHDNEMHKEVFKLKN